MTTRFDPDFNEEIRRVVKNFNQKRLRAYKRGFSYLPDRAYVSRIKQNFDTKKEIQKYLKDLEKFNTMGDSAFDVVETAMGGRISKYNLMFIKDNLKDTKDFFDRQIEEAKELFYEDQYSMARRDYLFNLQAKRQYLEQDIMNLTQSGIRTFEKYTKQALNNNRNMLSSYKGFLSVVENVMQMVGYDEKGIADFFGKMANLTPAQFIKMYRSNDLIGRIYELIISPKAGKARLNLDEDEARGLVDTMLRNFDKMKAEALDEEVPEEPQAKPVNKIPRSELSSQDVERLKAIGWDDLIDESK